MTESTRKPSAQRQESTRTRREQNRRSNDRQALSRRGAVMQAILAGASPERISGLLGRDGAGIPNSVLLDLLSRERPFAEREPRPLPSGPPQTEPFVWDGPFGTMEDGAAQALPGTAFPMGGALIADTAAAGDAAFAAEGGSLGGTGGPGPAGPVPG